ncbi:P-loop NTPase fold protein [Pseudoalteromonas sp. H105]|uniref:P-loop NTPase fold protein n=1 Tax=Pseudoalteromonas sp. H105 TaxID=1348393 RepID=UPI00128F0E90|nr:P-loop NTPase fold protein [Pseudoalteromonas sp. H105]
MSVLFGLLFIVGYVYLTHSDEALEQLIAQTFGALKFIVLSFLAIAATTIYQTKLYTEKPVFSAVLCAVSAFYVFSAIYLVEIEQAFCVFLFIAAAYLGMSIYLLWEQLKAPSAESRVESKQEAELTLESLEDFRKWFKDDSTIKNTEKLEPDLQVYAKRIADRLLKRGDQGGGQLKGAQHIALCGPFGCGKSSIVDSIASELAKSPKQSGEWIHSDISTWGAASGSVAHVVLSHIIDDISQHIDMCAFRALPKHYTEAMKVGGSFFQFASTLLAGPVDIEKRFKKLNDVLEATNHKLLITLQDVDRGTGDDNEKRLNDIAALLDRLKDRGLSHINFIIAMGNENEVAAEVISKATDYKEGVAAKDCYEYLSKYTKLCLESALRPNKGREIDSYKIAGGRGLLKLDSLNAGQRDSLSSELKRFEISISYINGSIASLRVLKKVLRRVEQIWQPGKLMGEVNFISLIMVTTFREVYPVQYARYQKLATKENQLLNRWSDPQSLKLKITDICKSNDDVQSELLTKFLEHMLRIDWRENDAESNSKQIVRDKLIDRGSIKESTASVIIESKDLKNIQLNPLRFEVDSSAIKSEKGSNNENLVMNPKFNYLQSVGCTNPAVNYLDRIQREQLQNTELSDQALIAKVIELRKSKDILEFLNKWLELDSDYRLGVERFFFIPHCCDDLSEGLVDFFESSSLDRGPNFQDFSKNCDIELSIVWLIAENLSLSNLYQVINFFFNSIEVNSPKSKTELGYVFYLLVTEMLDLMSDTSEPEIKRAFFRELNKAENEEAHMFFCLFLISCRGKYNFDVVSNSYKFDISSIKIAGESLNVILGVNSTERLEISINQDIKFDNALGLNKAIEKYIKPDFNR